MYINYYLSQNSNAALLIMAVAGVSLSPSGFKSVGGWIHVWGECIVKALSQ